MKVLRCTSGGVDMHAACRTKINFREREVISINVPSKDHAVLTYICHISAGNYLVVPVYIFCVVCLYLVRLCLVYVHGTG